MGCLFPCYCSKGGQLLFVCGGVKGGLLGAITGEWVVPRRSHGCSRSREGRGGRRTEPERGLFSEPCTAQTFFWPNKPRFTVGINWLKLEMELWRRGESIFNSDSRVYAWVRLHRWCFSFFSSHLHASGFKNEIKAMASAWAPCDWQWMANKLSLLQQFW